MNKEEASKLIGMIRSAFPFYYKDLTTEQIATLINLWELEFKEMDSRIVFNAYLIYCGSGKYPPTIADLKEIIYEQSGSDGLPDKETAWSLILKASRNDSSEAKKEFESLPDYLKKCTSPAMLHQIGMNNPQYNGQYKKDFSEAFDKVKEQKKKEFLQGMLPGSVREALLLEQKKKTPEA